MSTKRFFLSQDRSCHWYIIDASKRAEWDVWNEIDEDDPAGWNVPKFAREIDRPEGITFTDPIIL
jgi:hypothetical protein